MPSVSPPSLISALCEQEAQKGSGCSELTGLELAPGEPAHPFSPHASPALRRRRYSAHQPYGRVSYTAAVLLQTLKQAHGGARHQCQLGDMLRPCCEAPFHPLSTEASRITLKNSLELKESLWLCFCLSDIWRTVKSRGFFIQAEVSMDL